MGESGASQVAGSLVLVDPFGDDVLGPLDRLGGCLDLVAQEVPGLALDIRVVLRHDHFRQGLEPPLAGDLGACLPFGPEGEIEILDLGRAPGVADAPLQLRGQLSLLADHAQDGLFPLLQLFQLFQAFLYGADLDLVEPAGPFLAITADEGDRRALLQELYRAGDLLVGQPQLLRYDLMKMGCHILLFFENGPKFT